MSFIKEFREFALKGNMVDLAIGVIIGTAFGKVVSSLVSDIIMPPIGLILGGVDFSSLSLKLSVPALGNPPVEVKYGIFINNLINLFIISSVIFAVIKLLNEIKRKTLLPNNPEENLNPTTKLCPECLMSIPLEAKKCGFCCSSQLTHN